MIREPIADEFGLIYRPESGETADDLDLNEVIDYVRTRGAVAFIGFHLDIPSFEKFTNKLCTDWQTYQGGAHDKKVLNPEGDRTILSTNFYFGRKQQVAFELALHSDMSYQKTRPLLLFFYCVSPASSAGETMICDGKLVREALSPSTREFFETKRIKYIRRTPPDARQTRFWTDDVEVARAFCKENDLNLIVEPETGTWVTEYVVPAIRKSNWGNIDTFCNSILPVLWQEDIGKKDSIVRMEDDSKIPQAVIDEVKQVTERLTHLIRWEQPGDFGIVDNSRCLHGRKDFTDMNREIAQRMARSVTW